MKSHSISVSFQSQLSLATSLSHRSILSHFNSHQIPILFLELLPFLHHWTLHSPSIAQYTIDSALHTILQSSTFDILSNPTVFNTLQMYSLCVEPALNEIGGECPLWESRVCTSIQIVRSIISRTSSNYQDKSGNSSSDYFSDEYTRKNQRGNRKVKSIRECLRVQVLELLMKYGKLCPNSLLSVWYLIVSGDSRTSVVSVLRTDPSSTIRGHSVQCLIQLLESASQFFVLSSSTVSTQRLSTSTSNGTSSKSAFSSLSHKMYRACVLLRDELITCLRNERHSTVIAQVVRCTSTLISIFGEISCTHSVNNNAFLDWIPLFQQMITLIFNGNTDSTTRSACLSCVVLFCGSVFRNVPRDCVKLTDLMYEFGSRLIDSHLHGSGFTIKTDEILKVTVAMMDCCADQVIHMWNSTSMHEFIKNALICDDQITRLQSVRCMDSLIREFIRFENESELRTSVSTELWKLIGSELYCDLASSDSFHAVQSVVLKTWSRMTYESAEILVESGSFIDFCRILRALFHHPTTAVANSAADCCNSWILNEFNTWQHFIPDNEWILIWNELFLVLQSPKHSNSHPRFLALTCAFLEHRTKLNTLQSPQYSLWMDILLDTDYQLKLFDILSDFTKCVDYSPKNDSVITSAVRAISWLLSVVDTTQVSHSDNSLIHLCVHEILSLILDEHTGFEFSPKLKWTCFNTISDILTRQSLSSSISKYIIESSESMITCSMIHHICGSLKVSISAARTLLSSLSRVQSEFESNSLTNFCINAIVAALDSYVKCDERLQGIGNNCKLKNKLETERLLDRMKQECKEILMKSLQMIPQDESMRNGDESVKTLLDRSQNRMLLKLMIDSMGIPQWMIKLLLVEWNDENSVERNHMSSDERDQEIESIIDGIERENHDILLKFIYISEFYTQPKIDFHRIHQKQLHQLQNHKHSLLSQVMQSLQPSDHGPQFLIQ